MNEHADAQCTRTRTSARTNASDTVEGWRSNVKFNEKSSAENLTERSPMLRSTTENPMQKCKVEAQNGQSGCPMQEDQ